MFTAFGIFFMVACGGLLGSVLTMWRWTSGKKAPDHRPLPLNEKWDFLGQTIYEWSGKVGGTAMVAQRDIVMFHGVGPDYIKRKTVHTRSYLQAGFTGDAIETHGSYIRMVPRWLAGDNIYRGIDEPSDTLIAFARRAHNFDWDATAKKWISLGGKKEEKPAPHLPAKATDDVIDAIMKEKEG